MVSPLCRVSSSSRALMSSPGQSMMLPRWESSARSRIVPVVCNDLVVDELELAFVELDLVVLAVGEDRERPLGHLLLDFQEGRSAAA